MQIQTINGIYSYVEQPQMQVEVILASKGPVSPPIYTIRMRYPRPIHGEIMTHRVFGRNARSSRAVPVRTMLMECTAMPYVPWHWLKNKPGMQGTEELSEEEKTEAIFIWLEACRNAITSVKSLFNPDGLNIHKQNPNRLLEPFSWIDTLITSTDWNNFLWLRTHGAAEPHLQDLAHLVAVAIDETEVKPLAYGEWHQPYITGKDTVDLILRPTMETSKLLDSLTSLDEELTVGDLMNRISAARCARISYAPFDGDASYEKELARYNHLVTDERVHASPLEHQATPDHMITIEGMMLDEDGNDKEHLGVRDFWNSPKLHGNLTGYIQARKLVPNEYYSG